MPFQTADVLRTIQGILEMLPEQQRAEIVKTLAFVEKPPDKQEDLVRTDHGIRRMHRLTLSNTQTILIQEEPGGLVFATEDYEQDWRPAHFFLALERGQVKINYAGLDAALRELLRNLNAPYV